MTALFAIVASIFIGASDVAGGVASRTRDSASMTTLMHAIALPLLIVAAIMRGASEVLPGDLVAGAAAGAITGVAYIWFFTAMANGSVAIIVPITASTAVVTPVLVALVRGERPTTLAWLGVAACLIAVPLCGLGEGGLGEGGLGEGGLGEGGVGVTARPQWSALRQALVAATTGVGFGTFYAVTGGTSEASGTWPTVIVVTIAGLVTAAVSVWRAHSRCDAGATSTTFGGRPDASIVVAGVGLAGGDILNTVALQRGPLATASVLGNLYPLVAVVIARAVLSERFSRLQAAGLVLGVTGAGFISLG